MLKITTAYDQNSEHLYAYCYAIGFFWLIEKRQLELLSDYIIKPVRSFDGLTGFYFA